MLRFFEVGSSAWIKVVDEVDCQMLLRAAISNSLYLVLLVPSPSLYDINVISVVNPSAYPSPFGCSKPRLCPISCSMVSFSALVMLSESRSFHEISVLSHPLSHAVRPSVSSSEFPR